MKKLRPATLKSVTMRQSTSHGTLFVTIAYKRPRKPFEIFATIGKAGSCEHAWLEAITRMMTTALRYGVPASELIDQLRGIQCDPPLKFSGMTEHNISSPADAIALILADFVTLSKTTRHQPSHDDTGTVGPPSDVI